jgi:hypothetical protein
MMRIRKCVPFLSLTSALLFACHPAWSQSPSPLTPQDRLIFQTGHAWSPRININAGTVMVYGIDETTADRIRSWRDHG